MELLHKEITDKILCGYYNVYNTLGFGFLEKVYENAMVIELQHLGLSCLRQYPINVIYEGKTVGSYFVDILVENTIVVELKAAETLLDEHELQLINYLKATNREIGLLLNFGKNPSFKRKIFTNDKKKIRFDQ